MTTTTFELAQGKSLMIIQRRVRRCEHMGATSLSIGVDLRPSEKRARCDLSSVCQSVMGLFYLRRPSLRYDSYSEPPVFIVGSSVVYKDSSMGRDVSTMRS